MKHAIVSVIMVILLVLVPAGVMHSVSQPVEAQAAGTVSCSTVKISPQQVQIKCTAAGVVVLEETVDLPAGPTVTATVTLPPLPGATVTIPGPQETTTIEVEVPGPTQSVTVTAPDSEAPTVVLTETVTATQTVEASPSSLPSPTGQVDNGDGTLDPDTAEPDDPVISVPDIKTPAQAVGLGLLAVAVLTGIALLFLYLGYIVGYKDSDNANASFMASMLASIRK